MTAVIVMTAVSNVLTSDLFVIGLTPAVTGAFVVSAASEKYVRVYGLVRCSHGHILQDRSLHLTSSPMSASNSADDSLSGTHLVPIYVAA